MATDSHAHEEMSAATSLVQRPVVMIEPPPSRILGELDFMDNTPDIFGVQPQLPSSCCDGESSSTDNALPARV